MSAVPLVDMSLFGRMVSVRMQRDRARCTEQGECHRETGEATED